MVRAEAGSEEQGDGPSAGEGRPPWGRGTACAPGAGAPRSAHTARDGGLRRPGREGASLTEPVTGRARRPGRASVLEVSVFIYVPGTC